LPPPPPQLNSSLSASDAQVLQPGSSLELQLFDNLAQLKVTFSQIAMHLSSEWRTAAFEQIDALLKPENWEDDSSLIQLATFLTFLRFVILVAPSRLPSLGVGPTGNLLAAWVKDNQRIMIQFLPDDHAIATLIRDGTRGPEAVAWRGHVVDLKLFIDRFGVTECLIKDADGGKTEGSSTTS
jgi:hypothetical protein